MTSTILVKVVLWWVAILLLAILNGTLREKLLIPTFGTFAAFVTSGLILSALVFLVAYISVPGLGPLSAKGYWCIGLIWLAMTLIFELSFGLYIQHKELSELLEAYIFKGGNIWPVVLLSTAVSPWLAAHLRGVA